MSLFRPTTDIVPRTRGSLWNDPLTRGNMWNDPFFSNALQPFQDVDPFREFDRSLMQPFWGRGGLTDFGPLTTRGTFMDVIERDDGYDIRADLPGYPKESIDIKVANNTLTISADKSDVIDEDTDTYHRRERHVGKVRRSMLLPQDCNQDDVKANFEQGVLTVKISKLGTAAGAGKKIMIA